MSQTDAVPSSEVKQASKAMLQKQLYAVFTTPSAGLEPVFANLEAHLAFQVELEREGKMFAAGPLWTEDEQEWRGEGIIVLRAASAAEAAEIARQDPMHKAGARTFEIRPWMINEGALRIRLDYSSQTFTID